jgi:tRNA threonylcarbamoyladenosine biosynthesis protein TsaE
MSLHICHLPVKTGSEPGKQTRLGGRKVHICYADLGKSKLKRPTPYVGHQLRNVDLNTEHHPPIVESAASSGPGADARLWRSEDDTRAFAARLAAQPSIAEALIELHGDLGAGKTTLARHLLRALGVQGRVKSPTYTVVEPHEVLAQPGAGQTLRRLQIWHFDFFRFNDPREWEDAGFRDIFASAGLKLVEWPEKAAGLLPRPDLVIRIEAQADETRKVTVVAHTALGRELLQ